MILPDSVTTLNAVAFGNCKSLQSITLSSNLTTIEESTFTNCSSLSEIIIPNKVKTIKGYAFYGCKNLTNVTIGLGVTTINGYAFYECEALSSATFMTPGIWYVYFMQSKVGTYVLSDAAVAATYLKSTHVGQTWSTYEL